MTPRRPSQIWAVAFSALVLDSRVGHGAFHLWHFLYDHHNHVTGLCYPGHRLIRKEIRCDPHRITKWTDELEASGWLKIDRGASGANNRGFSYHYTLCDGRGKALPLFEQAAGDM